MDYKKISEALIELLGGTSNITSNAACMTRLRIGLKDTSKVEIERIKQVEGVLGVVESDTLQIVFGPGKVNKVLDEFYQLTGLPKVRHKTGERYRALMMWQKRIRPCKKQSTINRSSVS